MRILISAPAGGEDVEVSCPASIPFARLRPELTRELGLPPDGRLLVDGAEPALGLDVGSALRHGSVVSTGQPELAAPAPRLELRAVGGVGAGTAWPLQLGLQVAGRDPRHPITLQGSSASRTHASIRVEPHGTTLLDQGSVNGIWVRGQRVSATPLTPAEPVCLGGTAVALHTPTDPPMVTLARDGRLEVNRAPRVAPHSSPARFSLPAPPTERPAPRLPWLAMAGPLVVGIALAFLMDPRFLLFSLLSPVMAGGQALSDRWHHKRERTGTAKVHAASAVQVRAAMAAALALETTTRRDQAPDPAALEAIAAGPTARLWERRPGDADWLHLRLGLARLPSHAELEGDDAGSSVDLVPLVVDLTASRVVGIAGPADVVRDVGGWLLNQAATLHSPLELDVAVLAVDCSPWRWTRWLPHLVPSSDPAALLTAVRASGRPTLLVVDGARALRATPGLAELMRSPGPHSVVCLEQRPDDLPVECTAVATVGREPAPTMSLQVSGQRFVAAALPDLVAAGWCERVARQLAPLVDATPAAGAAALPNKVPWRAVNADQLLAAWAHPSTRVSLGMTVDGPWEVDLAVDGPHALVAGTTGSGKSEALRTLVAALAAANPPDALAFVLIDYKGGAAFGSCALLPHVAGMVTDLDPSLTERALVSLSAELRRRELLLRAAGVDDLRDYPGAAAGLEPLARLVIVVDEFATLAEELPDFVGGLVGVAQRGRSLGVHLVLATQRPEGCVSADIRANTSLRLCLAVARDTESRDVVDAPDAALIAPGTPGRGFARAGSGPLRPVHLARVTTPPPAATQEISVHRVGHLSSQPLASECDEPTALDLLVAATRELVERGAAAPARSPWLTPLPHPVPAVADRWAVGDLPDLQRYSDERFDLERDGHLLVIGAPRSGRSTAVQAIVHSLLSSQSADQLHVYAVDDSGGLGYLAELPHCGALVRTHDVDRLVRLVGMLSAEVARRRDAQPDDVPALLVVLDRWEAAVDALENRDGGRWVDALHALATDGSSAGLHVIAVVGGRAPSSRLAAAVDRKLVLRMADPTDAAMFGIPLRSLPAAFPPGRGFLVDAAGPRLVQVAEPATLGALSAALDCPPRRVDALPSSIDAVAAELFRRKPRPEGRACVLLGVGGDELAPVGVHQVDVAPAFVIAGPARSGRSTALVRLVTGLLEEGVRVAALLPRQSPLAQLPGLVILRGDESVPPIDHVLVCDDAELASADALALLDIAMRGARDGGPTVLLAGTSEDLAVGFRGPLVEARRSRCGLVLSPRTPHDGELLGTRLPQPSAGEPPPGRGALVLRGAVTTIQVAG